MDWISPQDCALCFAFNKGPLCAHCQAHPPAPMKLIGVLIFEVRQHYTSEALLNYLDLLLRLETEWPRQARQCRDRLVNADLTPAQQRLLEAAAAHSERLAPLFEDHPPPDLLRRVLRRDQEEHDRWDAFIGYVWTSFAAGRPDTDHAEYVPRAYETLRGQLARGLRLDDTRRQLLDWAEAAHHTAGASWDQQTKSRAGQMASPLYQRHAALGMLIKWLQGMAQYDGPKASWNVVMNRSAVEEYSHGGLYLDDEEREALVLGDALLERDGPAIAHRCANGLERHQFGYKGWSVDFLTRHLQADTEYLPKKLQREREKLRVRNELRRLVLSTFTHRMGHYLDGAEAHRCRQQIEARLAEGHRLSHSLRRLLRYVDKLMRESGP
ncbi:MAG: hypothetical protein KKI08_18015 [Armatimonadetes bacterium]|nr:hypothetical protein [Armatimonadota bacterium]